MILFLGLAGTGKSTQGRLLATHLHCPWVSTGNLLRQSMDAATQAEMLQGKMIDDQKTVDALAAEFSRIDAAKNECILDGSPRTMAQAVWLANQAKEGKIFISAVIHLLASQETARRRLLARRRPDDHDPAIAERFREYQESILPILDYLKKQGYKVYQMDAERPAEDVQKNIVKVLEAAG